MIEKMTLSEVQGVKLIPLMDYQTQFCYMSVIHLKVITATVKEIFDETLMFNLFLTLLEGHRAKLIATNTTDGLTGLFFYMSVIHLEAVTAIVKEICDKKLIIDLFDLIQRPQKKTNITTGLADPTFLYVCNTSEICNYHS